MKTDNMQRRRQQQLINLPGKEVRTIFVSFCHFDAIMIVVSLEINRVLLSENKCPALLFEISMSYLL